MLQKMLFILFTIFVCELLTVHTKKKKCESQYKLMPEVYWLKKKKNQKKYFQNLKEIWHFCQTFNQWGFC